MITHLITLGRYSISGSTSDPVLGSIMGLTSKHASVHAIVSHTVLSAKKRPGQILRRSINAKNLNHRMGYAYLRPKP